MIFYGLRPQLAFQTSFELRSQGFTLIRSNLPSSLDGSVELRSSSISRHSGNAVEPESSCFFCCLCLWPAATNVVALRPHQINIARFHPARTKFTVVPVVLLNWDPALFHVIPVMLLSRNPAVFLLFVLMACGH
ncbi:hypothetical protein SHLI107390_08235 [Shewanella livingstonensis]